MAWLQLFSDLYYHHYLKFQTTFNFQNGDMLYTFEEYTALGFDTPFNKETLNSAGISPKPGILYVPGPLVNRVPVGEYTSSSNTNKP